MLLIIYFYLVAGYVLKEAPFDAWAKGNGVDVPVLIGKSLIKMHPLITFPSMALVLDKNTSS